MGQVYAGITLMDLMVDPINRELVGVHGDEQVGIIL